MMSLDSAYNKCNAQVQKLKDYIADKVRNRNNTILRTIATDESKNNDTKNKRI